MDINGINITIKVQVVLGIEGGLMEYEPCVFITERGAKEYIIDTFAEQGIDYLEVCFSKMSQDDYDNKWGDKLEIHWYETTIE